MTRYLGGLITADETKSIPANNFEDTSASGIWTLSEAEMLNKQSLWPTAGVSNPVNFIENLFSVDTYTGIGGNLTVTTGVDTLNEGGLIWLKDRSNSISHGLFDTVRGTNQQLLSNTTGASEDGSGANNRLYEFTSTGFKVGDHDFGGNNREYVAWTFRKTPKFFDVVGWSGNGSAGRQISHSLGSVPGMVIVKNLTVAGNGWYIFHRSLGNTKVAIFTTDLPFTGAEWNNTTPTDAHFTLSGGGAVNASGSN